MSDPGAAPPALLESAGQAAQWLRDRPWLLAVAAAAVLVTVVAHGSVQMWRHRRWTRHARQVTITPPPEVAVDGAAVWWATLAEILRPVWWRRLIFGTPHVAMEYRWAGRHLSIVIWVPGTIPTNPVAAAASGAWPGASCIVDDPAAPVPLPPAAAASSPAPDNTSRRPAGLRPTVRALRAAAHRLQPHHDRLSPAAVGGALLPTLPDWHPLRTEHDADPLRPLLSAAAGLGDHQHACVQILARPAPPSQVRRLRRSVGAQRAGSPYPGPLHPGRWLGALLDTLLPTPARQTPTTGNRIVSTRHPERDRDLRAAVDKLVDGPLWQTAIRYAVVHTNPRRVPAANLQAQVTTLAHGIAASFGVYSGARQRLRRLPMPNPARVLAGRPLRGGFLLSTDELAVLAGLPLDLAVPGLLRARAKPMPAPIDVPDSGRNIKILGRAEVGGHTVGLAVADARHHLHVIGSTGTGKSTLLVRMIVADILAGRAVVVIDPKGDLVTDVLDRIPAAMADRVILIDPNQPGGDRLNPLLGDDPDLTVDNIVSIFAKIFQRFWGPRMDDIFRMAGLTLIRHANPVLTNISPLLLQRQFRSQLTVDLDDPEGLRGFWDSFETTPHAQRAQMIAPVLSRLRLILTRPFPKYTLGAATSTFDMGKALNTGGIVLARLPKGQLGEDTARVMGSFVLSTAWQAATARARKPEDQRRDATVFVDEAHNFLNLPGSVDDMLAEARGYHLALVLAHQNLAQLPTETQRALSANARNKIFFDVAPEDAVDLAKHTLPELDAHDLSHMDVYRAAARLVAGGRPSPAFTLRTLPPAEPVGEATAIRQACAARVAGTDPDEPAVRQLARRTRRP
ncbi:type IV secretion system DNA-binding domain-containing protein [Phytohabitans houttuyneae]|uniref:type IV secretion system DNA-binding domain-containing protein n=1 Tax=Phytohabitans houttuyneae TaxID=1076126 RepID=UPI0031E634E8